MTTPQPDLDLILERDIDVPPHLVWRAWTQPEHVKKWFTPAPWTTIECEIDLRPGGIFRTVMRSPEGETYPNLGCYLEVEENRRLTWTNALYPGFRPHVAPEACPTEAFSFTAILTFEPHGSGTRYKAVVLHPDADSRQRHEALGFHDGWSAALDQLIALAKTMAS